MSRHFRAMSRHIMSKRQEKYVAIFHNSVMTKNTKNGSKTLSRQKMRINLAETIELCRGISIDCCDKTKGKMKKECRDIAKFVTKKADKSSQNFVAIIVFKSRQNLPRSAVHGKERMSRHLKLCRDNYEME